MPPSKHASATSRRPFGPPPWLLALVSSMILAACQTPPEAPPPEPAKPTLEALMRAADQLKSDGARDKARASWRAAAESYPTSAQPWSKLALDFFSAGDYSHAIEAADEVLKRDPANTVAHSVLSVSGLRVSSRALQALRAQNRIGGNERTEAEAMTRTLREVLGEQVLVPPASPDLSPTRPPVSSKRKTTKRPAAPATTLPATAPAPTAPAPTAPASAAAGNPFDRLN